MKYTNRAKLPQAIVDAVTRDPYTKGTANMSVTGLLKPPRIVVLEKQFDDKITEDVSDRIWSLFGQAIHTILERANRTAVAERRLSITMEGWEISGGMDVYQESDTLVDYKTTSVWKLVKGDLDEWEKQLNLYAVILRHHGHKVEKLQVAALLRDWSVGEASRDAAYPQAQVVSVDIQLWEPSRAEQFMRERIILHKQAQMSYVLMHGPDFELERFATKEEAQAKLKFESGGGILKEGVGSWDLMIKEAPLPECTPIDKWSRPDVFAVMKPGRKSAVRLYSSETEAKAHAATESNLYVTHRLGVDVRCQNYCRVSQFCEQFKQSQKLSFEDEKAG